MVVQFALPRTSGRRHLDHLAEISDYIALLLSSEHFHLLLVQGPPGWGKSSLCRAVLDRLGRGYRELGSYATPLGLFNGLVDHPDELLMVDDCAGLFHNPLSMSLLNAATWPVREGGPRTVRWTSTTELAASASIDFKGKMIVLTNALPTTPQAQAFRSRALNYRLDISRHNIAEHLVAAASSAGRFADAPVATEVARFLGQQADHHDAEHISLRTLRLGYELATVNPSRWKDLLLKALPRVAVDPKQLVLDLSQQGSKVELQAATFMEQTGLSRRRFFYFREQLGLSESTKTRASSKGTAKPRATNPSASAAAKAPLRVVQVGRTKPEARYVADID